MDHVTVVSEAPPIRQLTKERQSAVELSPYFERASALESSSGAGGSSSIGEYFPGGGRAVDAQTADPAAPAQQLGRHHEHPAESEAAAQARQIGGQRARQKNGLHQPPAPVTEESSHLEPARVERRQPEREVEVHGEEH